MPARRQVFGRGMANSVDALLCLLLLVAIACVLFGALIFECAHARRTSVASVEPTHPPRARRRRGI